MSKYCAKCKMNFTDSFSECVYCGSSLLNGTIESDESNVHVEETNILKMTDEEILKNIKHTNVILKNKPAKNYPIKNLLMA